MQHNAIDDPSTSKYQHTLPWALQNIYPALAALHATRTRALHLPNRPSDPLTSTHCARCGTYLLNGMGTVRTLRKTKRALGGSKARPAVSYSRKLRRVCNVCGHAEDIPLDNAKAPSFPRVRRRGADEKSVLIPMKALGKTALLPREPVQSQSDSIKGSAASSTSRASSVVSAQNTPRTASLVSTPPPQASAKSSSPSASSASESGPTRMRARPKKKSGLQEMLARNRERQEQEKRSGTSGGLSAFLETL
ncbi:hypothetical protein EIP86_004774 [Pleurotus ostreatoroseus]|nr:hypothetical protein EIP86_004774 [Pleurotus ostreatoroseus]